jgi:cation transport protein ChaC
VEALTFVADPHHPSYAGRMTDEEVARRIACCAGARGPNLDYLANTLRHLEALGVRDAHVARIYRAVQELGASQ